MTALPLTANATDAAVLDAVPCYPVPPSGLSPAIDGLRAERESRGILVGRDGMMLVLRRAWLELDQHISPPPPGYLPYGLAGPDRCKLRCGLVPAQIFEAIDRHFASTAPCEAAAFVTWNETTKAFSLVLPEVLDATTSRLVYRPPVLAPGEHLVIDAHSHGSGSAYFSSTDDADDQHATKIAIVIGGYGTAEKTIAMRLCASGAYIPLPAIPFERPGHVE